MAVLAKDRFLQVAPYIGDAGVCAEDEAQILAYLNIVVPMLMKRMDSKGTIFTWCMPSHNGCFSMPEDCLEARQLWIDGFPLVQRDQWYEGKLSVGLDGVTGRCGIGANCNQNAFVRWCDMQNVFDVGDGFAIPTPWPGCKQAKVGLLAENDGDAGKEVILNITNEYSDNRQFSVTLPSQQEMVIVDSFVKDVTFLRKPQTLGNVVMYVVNPNGTRQRYCHYSPRVITASWRRKKLPRQNPCNCGALLVKGKARFYEMRDGNDTMLIDDVEALAWGCQAINAQRRNDLQAYNSCVALAVNELEKQLADSSSRMTVGQSQFLSPFGASARTRAWL